MKEKIILRSDVDHLGLAGEVVEVARGYARNYLFPKKLALPATPANQKLLAVTMATVAERRLKVAERAKELAGRLEQVTLTIPAKVGETGRLFGSVTSMDIAQALSQAGFSIDRKKIEIKSPIKVEGSHTVTVKLEVGVIAPVKVVVVNEAAPAEAEEEAAPAEA